MNSLDLIKLNIIEGIREIKIEAVQVNEYLAVARRKKGWKVYAIHSGKELIPVSFVESRDAQTFADFYVYVFRDFLDIWIEYPNAIIHKLAKWSVHNGLDIHNAIETEPEQAAKLFLN